MMGYSRHRLKKNIATSNGLPSNVDLSGNALNPFNNTSELTPVLPQQRSGVKKQQQALQNTANQQQANYLNNGGFEAAINEAGEANKKHVQALSTDPTYARKHAVKQALWDDKHASSKYVANAPLAGMGTLSSGIQDVMANLLGGLGAKDGQDFENIIKGVREQNSTLREAPEKVLGFDISKKDRDEASKEFLTGAFRGLGESVPAMLTPSGAGMYLQAYDNGIQQINNTEEGKKLPEWAKTSYGATVGLAQGALEKVGLNKIIKTPKLLNNVTNKIINNVFGGAIKSGEKLTSEAAENLINKEVSALSSKVRQIGAKALSGFATETATGTAQETAQVLTEIAANKSSGKDIFDVASFGETAGRIARSGLQEGVGGFVMGGGAGAAGSTENTIRNEVAKASPQELQQVSDEITDQITSDENLSDDDKGQLAAKVKQYQEIATTIPETVAPKQKSEIIDNIVTRNDIDAAIEQKTAEMESVDEAFKPQIQNEIDVLADQRKQVDKDIQDVLARPIEEDVTQENTTTEGDTTVDTTVQEQANVPEVEVDNSPTASNIVEETQTNITNEPTTTSNETPVEEVKPVRVPKKIPEYKDIRTEVVDKGEAATPETLASTVNEKTWYHGSGKDLSKEGVNSSAFTRPDSLLGLGFYMTDNPEIASTYGKLRRNNNAGIVNEFKVKTDRILDAEKPIDNDVADTYKSVFRAMFDGDAEASKFFDDIKSKNPDASLMDYHKAVRELVSDNEMTTSEALEFFQDLEIQLKDELGYDALSHIGGVQTNGKKHNVIILLDPGAEYSNPKKTIEKTDLYDSEEDAKPTVDVRQKAIDAITHGIIGDGERAKGDTSPRFDLGMDTRDQKRAIRDITNGNYETAVAKKLIDKVAEFEAKGEYPIIEGLGGAANRTKFATAEEIHQSIDDIKQYKSKKLSEERAAEFNKYAEAEHTLTEEDFDNYDNYRNDPTGERASIERDAKVATGEVQRAKDDQKASRTSDTSSEAAQGKPTAGDPLRIFADKVRAGKISKLGGFKAGTGFDAVWDASLEVVATAVEGGAKLADAIEMGLKHVKSTEWYKSLSNQKEFDTEYRNHLRSEFKATEKELTGITHKETKKSREKAGLPEYEKITKDDAELNAQADKALKDGYNVADLIAKMEEGNLPKDYEQVILRKFISSVSAEIAENPTAENLSLYKRALDVSDKIGGSELARSLAARRGLVVKENNLANFIYDEMAAFGVEKLPKESIDKLKTEFTTEQELQQKYEEGYQKAIDEMNAKKAKSSIDKTRGSIQKSRPSTVELAKERKAIVTDMRAALLKAAKGGYGAMSSIPYAAQLRAIAPYVPKLVRNLVADGKVRIEDVVSSIHEELKDFIDEITEKDVRDLIAGQYREKRGRNEINAQIRDLQTQAKLLAKIADLEVGVKKAKNIAEEVRKSKEIEELQKRVKEVELRNIELFGPEDNTLTPEQRLASKQATLKSELAKAKYELENSTFDEVPPPEKLILDPETRKYQDELIDIRKKIRLRRDKAYYDRLPKWERYWDKFTQIAGLRRLVQTAFDLSMPFRQGITVTLNPRAYGLGLKNVLSLKGLLNTPSDVRNSVAIKSWENMLKTTFSQKNFDRMMFEMEQSPIYKDMIDDELHFNDVETLDNNNRNEDFRSSFIYEIPYLREPLIASNRAAAGFINTARYEIYLKGKKTLEQQGITRENSPESYTELAKWAMNLTGRGNFHKALENNPTAQRVLGNTFFGARLMASRFNLLNPRYYYKLPKEMRVEALKDIGGYATMAVITMLAAKAAGASVTMDPDDSDFGKAQWGNKRYDIVSGGISQYIRTYLRIAKAIYMRANPNVSKKRADKYSKFATTSTSSFLRYKLSPNTSYALSAFNGKDPIGKDFNAMDIAKIYPMYVDDMVEGWKQDGPTAGMTILLPSIFGMGVQNYEDKKTKKQKKQEQEK